MNPLALDRCAAAHPLQVPSERRSGFRAAAGVRGNTGMDYAVSRFAKELADAIAVAVAENPQVEACRAKARDAGFDMKVTLEAVVGFVNRNNGTAVTKITTPARLLPARRAVELTANDKRVLRSLRIGAERSGED